MKRNIFLVEMWSDNAGLNGMHQVDVIHVASSQRKARRFCDDHMDYGGLGGGSDYYPWHFRIRQIKMDEDGCCTVLNTSRVLDIIRP